MLKFQILSDFEMESPKHTTLLLWFENVQKTEKKFLQGWVMQPMYSLSNGGFLVLYLKICKDPLGSEWCKFYQKSVNARMCLYTCWFFVSLQRHYTITRQIYMYPLLISLLQIAKLSQEWLLYLWCLQLSVWPCAQLNVIPQHFSLLPLIEPYSYGAYCIQLCAIWNYKVTPVVLTPPFYS